MPSCAKYRDLCEVVGIGAVEIKESLDRITPDVETLGWIVGDLASHRAKMAENENGCGE
jgi:hypothetical protein